MNSLSRSWTRFVSAAFHGLLLCGICLLPCCTVMDPAYKELEAQARVQCQPNDVVGVWVSKITSVGFPQRRTLLLRPDGTGRLRLLNEGINKQEYDVNWHYSGGGVWDGMLSRHGHSLYKFKLRTTSLELLYHVYNFTNTHAVFESADDI